MTYQTNIPAATSRHLGPPPGVVAIVFTVLCLTGVFLVSGLGSAPRIPGPSDGLPELAGYFQLHSSAVLLAAFLAVGAAIPLGLFTATIVSRMRFLGVRATGAYIALFGGFASA